MKLKLLTEIYNKHVKIHSDFFNLIFDCEYWPIKDFRAIYRKLTKNNNDPERELNIDELFDVAEFAFNLPVYRLQNSFFSYDSIFNNDVKRLEKSFEDYSIIKLLQERKLLNKDNFKKLYEYQGDHEKLELKLLKETFLTQYVFDRDITRKHHHHKHHSTHTSSSLFHHSKHDSSRGTNSGQNTQRDVDGLNFIRLTRMGQSSGWRD